MGFQWPLALLSLLVVPLLVAAYVWQDRRRRRQAVRHSSVALIRAAAPKRAAWKRHVPFALVLARTGPARRGGGPAAAQLERADLGLDDHPRARRVGLDVLHRRRAQPAHGGRERRPRVRQEPGRRHPHRAGRVLRVRAAHGGADHRARRPAEEPRRAHHRPRHGDRRRHAQVGRRDLRDRPRGGAVGSRPGRRCRAPRARPPGTYAPEIVVLLTDGANTTGVEPADAAKAAAERGVRVYPIGFGTRNPAAMVCTCRPARRSGLRELRRR